MKESINALIRGVYFGFGVSVVWIMMVAANDILLSPKIEELNKQRELTLFESQRGKLDIEPIDISHAENGIVAKIRIFGVRAKTRVFREVSPLAPII